MLPDSRECRKCGLDKPLPEFSKAPRGKYGRKATCKSCDAARHAAKPHVSRALSPEVVRQRIEERRGDTKRCTKCQEVKPRTEFHKSHNGKHGPILKSICKLCHTTQVRGWYAQNSDQSNSNRRRLQLKQNYGLTLDEYDAMAAEQHGVCAICKRPERAMRDGKLMRMAVDHCHETGRVRALLCHACNRAIGLMGEDVELMSSAINYLLQHKAEAEQ